VRIRRALVPILLTSVAALTACGGDDSGDSEAVANDTATTATDPATGDATGNGMSDPGGEATGDALACDLLTTDEVAAAVGVPGREGIPTSGPAITGGDFTTCVWQSDDPAHPADTATLTVYDNTAAADSVRSDDSPPLDGIGDDAFSDSVSTVWVYDGEKSFFTQWYIFGTMDDEGLEQAKALATAAADKM